MFIRDVRIIITGIGMWAGRPGTIMVTGTACTWLPSRRIGIDGEDRISDFYRGKRPNIRKDK
jgi:hypothetical protein